MNVIKTILHFNSTDFGPFLDKKKDVVTLELEIEISLKKKRKSIIAATLQEMVNFTKFVKCFHGEACDTNERGKKKCFWCL